jgi:DNA-binding response OmpR family regulator
MSRTAAAISVLVVEDEVMISNLVADCLSESGFRVHEVATADEALS